MNNEITFDSTTNWLYITILGILMMYLSLTPIPIPQKYLGFFQQYFYLTKSHNDYYLEITYQEMTHNTIFHNFVHMFLLTMIMAAYGNIANRFSFDHTFSLMGVATIGTGYLSIPIFGMLGQVKGMQFSVTPNFWQHLSIQAKVSMIVLITGVTLNFAYQINAAYAAGELATYLLCMTLIPVVYIAAYRCYLEPGETWHIHHWFIGYYFSLMTRYNLPILLMVFWGVFLEGAITYGATSIVFPNQRNKQS